MTRLPLLLSVPHAGLAVPVELAPYSRLTPGEVEADGDVGARQIYALEDAVAAFVTTDVARAFVDMNRAVDDRRKDGVVKTHTCWDIPIWNVPPPESAFQGILERHHRPYHERLTRLATSGVVLGIDCHTMAAVGPPVAPDPGKQRPAACLGFGEGTCPEEWARALAECLRETLGASVTINEPFRGGWITRSHAAELPWIQLELSRAPDRTHGQKRQAVLEALERWCRKRNKAIA